VNDERLSAYLDDELTPSDVADLEIDLTASQELRTELAELRATRTLIRNLPEVAPRRTLERRSPAPVRRPGRLGIMVAGVAAVWVLVLSVGISLGSLPIVPEIDQLALQHAAANESEMPMPFVSMDTTEMMASDAAIMADIGHGMGLEGVYQLGPLVQARYSDGVHAISIFHEPGEVDWDDLPSGDVKLMPDGLVWRSTIDDIEILVTERGGLVVTVVTDGDMEGDMATMASSMVPEVDMAPSVWSRMWDAPGNILDRL
jgi:hypothetical protein